MTAAVDKEAKKFFNDMFDCFTVELPSMDKDVGVGFADDILQNAPSMPRSENEVPGEQRVVATCLGHEFVES